MAKSKLSLWNVNICFFGLIIFWNYKPLSRLGSCQGSRWWKFQLKDLRLWQPNGSVISMHWLSIHLCKAFFYIHMWAYQCPEGFLQTKYFQCAISSNMFIGVIGSIHSHVFDNFSKKHRIMHLNQLNEVQKILYWYFFFLKVIIKC